MKKYPLSVHLSELKKRILYTLVSGLFFFCLGLFQTAFLYDVLTRPLVGLNFAPSSLLMTSLSGGFSLSLRLAFLVSVMGGMPVLIYQIWRYILPALKKKEIPFFRLSFLFSPVLFALGALLAYFFIAPLAWDFLLSFYTLFQQAELPAQMLPQVDEYLNLMISFMVAFGFSFQLPLLLILLIKWGLVSVDLLRKKRRQVIVFIFIVAAVLTPPDVLSQILLAVPLIILYEVAIFFGRKM